MSVLLFIAACASGEGKTALRHGLNLEFQFSIIIWL